MNFEFFKAYQNLKEIIKEEQAAFYGYLFILVFGTYVIHTVFQAHGLAIWTHYYGIVWVFALVSFAYWIYRFNRVAYRKWQLNVLFFPFENSAINKAFDRKYEINAELYRVFYGTMELLKYSNWEENPENQINIVRMPYKFDGKTDTDLLKEFDRSDADIIVRWKIVNDGNSIGIMPVILFTKNFKSRRGVPGNMAYLITTWNIISLSHYPFCVELDGSTAKNMAESLDRMREKISNLFSTVLVVSDFFQEKLSKNHSLLQSLVRTIEDSYENYHPAFQCYFDTLRIRVLTRARKISKGKAEEVLANEKIQESYSRIFSAAKNSKNAVLQKQYFFSVLHEYGSFLYEKGEDGNARKAFELSLRFLPNGHAIKGLYDIFLKHGELAENAEYLMACCDDLIESEKKTVFRYAGYYHKGRIQAEILNTEEAEKNLTEAKKILQDEGGGKRQDRIAEIDGELEKMKSRERKGELVK